MLYQELAERLQTLIADGVFPVGTALPGVRRLSQQYGVSISTVVNACRELEQRQLLEARPRSGYFVCPPAFRLDTPVARASKGRPHAVSGQEQLLQLVQAAGDRSMVNLGAAVPDAEYMPASAIEQAFRAVWREQRRRCMGYEFPPGAPELRVQIARRLAALQCRVNPDQVLITNSCHEALIIALRMLTSPGDVVALESPTYYGMLQAVDALGLKVVEIPSDPTEGISLEALKEALERWPIKACAVVANFSNPLGVCLSDERKQALLRLLSSYRVPLVEDDIYGDLPFSGPRPRPIKSWDTEGLVYYCSSSSKTLAAGLRVGWLVPGKDAARASYLQFINTVSVATASQLALAKFLERGRFEREMRQVSALHARSVAHMAERVSQLFPPGTRLSRPSGGFVLWVELPGKIDTSELIHDALQAGVSFAPGKLFSATGKYANCLRLNCAVHWDARVERALADLVRLIDAALR